MDWNSFAEKALTVGATGIASFGGAFFRFKQRLKEAEDAAKAAKADAEIARAETAALRGTLEAAIKGWRMEFDDFKGDYQRDREHAVELEEARNEARESRPDPAEALRDDIDELRRQVEKIRERTARYVKNETFVEFTRGQEAQWKIIERTLGRLEALAR